MTRRTVLYDSHLAAHAKMVDFAGWEMPIHYGSQLAEHDIVRTDAGIFDVSHMGVVDIQGEEAAAFLRFLLPNNIDRLIPGQALYSCLLNHEGGVLDDLIVYKLEDSFFRVVINASTVEKDMAWFKEQSASFQVAIHLRHDVAIIATQGPRAVEKIAALFKDDANTLQALKTFHSLTINNKFVARTGYTGEDGYEWIIPKTEAMSFWQSLIDAGFAPCGLGARDTLRLEAGLNLYGADMDESVTPLESNLSWTVAWEPRDRRFIGRETLEHQEQAGIKRNLVGLLLEESGIPRSHQRVFIDGIGEGEITSGSFSPTLKKGIALARLPVGQWDRCWVEIRGKKIAAKVVKPPFVKYGKKMV